MHINSLFFNLSEKDNILTIKVWVFFNLVDIFMLPSNFYVLTVLFGFGDSASNHCIIGTALTGHIHLKPNKFKQGLSNSTLYN